ncbi:MAG: ZIP family metal transporter [Clostridiales bacterium]|nr:ZIP family metal transporter [Clostridiales bacterium]
MDYVYALIGIMIPFVGTVLGAACVFLLKDKLKEKTERALLGFASGVMVAASIFSLLLPAIDESRDLENFDFLPPSMGFLFGIFFLLFLDRVVPHIHPQGDEEGPATELKRTTKMLLAITIHNIPEGMAVGVVVGGWFSGRYNISLSAALVLSIGIAIQNFPEGAIVSMPLHAEGMPKDRTFLYGALSGIVEPIAALAMMNAAGVFSPVMPYLLSFAAGAMIYVVIEELVPEMAKGEHSNVGTIWFALGFVLMMAMDVAL